MISQCFTMFHLLKIVMFHGFVKSQQDIFYCKQNSKVICENGSVKYNLNELLGHPQSWAQEGIYTDPNFVIQLNQQTSPPRYDNIYIYIHMLWYAIICDIWYIVFDTIWHDMISNHARSIVWPFAVARLVSPPMSCQWKSPCNHVLYPYSVAALHGKGIFSDSSSWKKNKQQSCT